VDASDWDTRYTSSELVWGASPNAVVVEQFSALPAGRALDLGCGEGRNALWLAAHGWEVDALDFSQVGIDKARTVAARLSRTVRERIRWVRADATRLDAVGVRSPFDAVLSAFLHLPVPERRILLHRCATRLSPTGRLLILGHHPDNTVGGPQDPSVLFTPEDIADDLAPTGLAIPLAETLDRDTDHGTALDTLVLAVRS
jgi:SAM-dependent methyltransferase